MSTVQPNRYVALDVLRGMTVAGMILVNNPGSWSHIFPPLKHAAWAGCTPTDLVFPFFLFVVGAAMAFSFAKYEEGLTGASVKKLLRRGCLIFLVGLGLNAFPFYPTSADPQLTFGENYLYYLKHLRIFGVLQRIAFCYVAGGLVALRFREPKKIIPVMAGLMILHQVILCLIGGAEPYSLQGNGAGAIDIALLGETHVYHGFGIAFDPEGLLGVLSGACTVLLGFMTGNLIRTSREKTETVARLYTTGLLCLAGGLVWSIFYPIVKALWTGSYVLYAGGWSIIMLAFFIYLVDIKGREKLFTPFRAMGMNPLFAFVMAGVFAKVFSRIIRWKAVEVLADGTVQEKTWAVSSWFYQRVCVALAGGSNEYSSLLYALVYVAVFMGMALWLYRKKIVIKL